MFPLKSKGKKKLMLSSRAQVGGLSSYSMKDQLVLKKKKKNQNNNNNKTPMPSPDWVRPTHTGESDLLYSVYQFKC